MTKTASATVSQPTQIFTSTSVTNVSVNGGSNGAINLSVSGGTPGYTFNWSNGAWTEDINNLQAGTYTVTVTDVNGCASVFSATVTQPAPCVAPDAQFNLPVSGGLSNLQFTNTTVIGTAPLTYEWWFGDGGFSTDFNPTHTYAQSGVYTVTLRVTNACGQQDIIWKTLTVLNGPTPAQEPGNDEFNITVGPNPTTDKVFVKATGEYEVLLVAADGKIVRDLLTDGDFEISLGNLPSGIYFMNMLSEGKLHKSFPVVKQ
jgi:PKD repeat protein